MRGIADGIDSFKEIKLESRNTVIKKKTGLILSFVAVVAALKPIRCLSGPFPFGPQCKVSIIQVSPPTATLIETAKIAAD